ncbi:hypothetical protein MKK50_05895 [Methylobacterium sp. J-043]|nr:hypothetical protein [Methylobacterium sp. J-043]
MRGIPALLALPALIFLDALLVGGMFLYQPAGGEVFTVVLLAGALAAAVTRRRWLLFATQNLVTALAAVRLVQLTDPIAPGESIPVLVALLLGNLLAWLVAGVFPRRPGWI